MLQTHVLNQRSKRLEPVDNKCKFCNEGHSELMGQNYFCPLYSVMDRTNIVVYRSVKFNKITVGVSRCKSCKDIHESSYMYGWIICIVFLLLLVGYVNMAYDFFTTILVVVFVPAVVLVLGPRFVADLITKNRKILTQKEGSKKEPIIKEMLRGGWSLNQPNA